jgi:hypothetical protein
VKNRFQSLPFKRNLQRYNEEEAEFVEGSAPGRQPAGLYELNPVDLNHSVKAPGFSKPLRLKCDVLVSNFAFKFNLQLESAWFQPLKLKCDIPWFQSFAFKWVNVYRYTPAGVPALRLEEEMTEQQVIAAGAAHVESSLTHKLETARFQPLNL